MCVPRKHSGCDRVLHSRVSKSSPNIAKPRGVKQSVTLHPLAKRHSKVRSKVQSSLFAPWPDGCPCESELELVTAWGLYTTAWPGLAGGRGHGTVKRPPWVLGAR